VNICGLCEFYECRSYLASDGSLNVSGKYVFYRIWCSPQCSLHKDMTNSHCESFNRKQQLAKSNNKYRPLEDQIKQTATIPTPKTVSVMNRWHNDYCDRLDGKSPCNCKCGWCKLDSTSWIKYIKAYGWRKALKLLLYGHLKPYPHSWGWDNRHEGLLGFWKFLL
jgi:hypothetical protein